MDHHRIQEDQRDVNCGHFSFVQSIPEISELSRLGIVRHSESGCILYSGEPVGRTVKLCNTTRLRRLHEGYRPRCVLMRGAHLWCHSSRKLSTFFTSTVPRRVPAENVKVAPICAIKTPHALPNLKSGYVYL